MRPNEWRHAEGCPYRPTGEPSVLRCTCGLAEFHATLAAGETPAFPPTEEGAVLRVVEQVPDLWDDQPHLYRLRPASQEQAK